MNVAADVRRRTTCNERNPPPHVGGYKKNNVKKTLVNIQKQLIFVVA
jgi:hypothetical protein